MTMRRGFIGFLLVAAVGVTGFLIGAFLQAPGEVIASFSQLAAVAQSAPEAIAPSDGSEFVDSEIALEWSWEPDLAPNQLFALRIWADDLPYQEIWTAARRLSVKQTIDSFSVDYGKFFWQVAVVDLASSGVYKGMGSEWSPVSVLQRLRRPRIPAKPFDKMSATAKQFHGLNLAASDLIDAVHIFIHQNSLTTDQLNYAPDFSDAVELMYDHSQGATSEMPQILCDGRSTAMLTVLKELGIESRLVFLYKSDPGWLSQHTVLEVFNPDAQYWQVHDVGGDIYFIDADSGIRVDAESMLFDSHDDLLGCPVDGNTCSAELAANTIAYFQALRYGFTFDVWVNPDRFDLSSRFAGQDNQNLAEYITEGDPQRITIRMDSWIELK